MADLCCVKLDSSHAHEENELFSWKLFLGNTVFKNVSHITLGQEFRSEKQTSLPIFSRFQSDHTVFMEFRLGLCLSFTKHL